MPDNPKQQTEAARALLELIDMSVAVGPYGAAINAAAYEEQRLALARAALS